MSKVRNLMRIENPPGYIVFHVGGNDLEYVKVGFLRNRIKNIIRKIRALLPNTRIIWLEIPPRNQWGYSQNHDAMNRARKRINSSIGAFVLQLGGYYIQYPDIALDVQFLKRDVVHLTDLGNEIFLNTLQGALESFVLSVSS
jgi:lysophospholipase L1-like esterase